MGLLLGRGDQDKGEWDAEFDELKGGRVGKVGRCLRVAPESTIIR